MQTERLPDIGPVASDDIPFAGQSVSQTLDGRYVVQDKMFANTQGLNTGNLLYFHYPNTWNHVMPD